MTREEFEAIFQINFLLVDPPGPPLIGGWAGKGGCGRKAPNGVDMESVVLQSIPDAWNVGKKGLDRLPPLSDGSSQPPKFDPKVSGLLFLFFGLEFRENALKKISESAYKSVRGEFAIRVP